MLSKKSFLLLATCSVLQTQCAASLMRKGAGAGLVLATLCVAERTLRSKSSPIVPKDWALEKLKNTSDDCTLHFTSDLMIDNYDEVFLVRNKVAEGVDARFVYNDFSHYHRIDPELAKRPVKNLKLCALGTCVALPHITTRGELEHFLEEGGMCFDMKAKIFAEELEPWQTQETHEEHYKRIEKE